MSDQFDAASEIEETYLTQALAYRMPEKTMKNCGACYSCGQMCRGLFCDDYCKEDHEAEQAAKKRNGLR